MTSRMDADIRAHVMYAVKLEKEPRNFAAGKTGLVGWIVTNCQTHSRREVYVSEMNKHLPQPVDTFGKCGNRTDDYCPRTNATLQCTRDIIRRYKFYIAFENR